MPKIPRESASPTDVAPSVLTKQLDSGFIKETTFVYKIPELTLLFTLKYIVNSLN